MPLYRQPRSPFWWVRIGRKTRKSTGTADRSQAEEFERALTQRLWRRDKLGDRSATSWNEATKRWLTEKDRARKRDREILAWLMPKIGNDPVSAVADPDALEQLRQDALEEGWSRATADRVLATVSSVLHACVRWRILEHVPPVPMFRPRAREPRWITRPQFEKLQLELPEHLALAAEFAILTMLRMRSMLSLTWDRIDLAKRRAWIPGAQMKAARTHGLPLSKNAVKVLRKLKALNPDGDHVFQWNGAPIDDCNTLAFQKAVERAGVAPLRWHDLRHTGASWAVQNGVTLPQLMELGSWKSYQSVLRYAHLAPDHLASAAELVGRNVAYRKKAPRRAK
jgi:integrase